MSIKRSLIQSYELLCATLRLMKKTLYKTVEYQLIFRLLYITILIYIINASIGALLKLFDLIHSNPSLNVPIITDTLTSIFDFRMIFAIALSLCAIIIVYTIEKNGIIMITGAYYRGKPISFFNALFHTIRNTPRFIYQRASDLKAHLLIILILYIYWRLTTSPFFYDNLSIFFAALLIIYVSGFFYIILFSFSRTGLVVNLDPTELPSAMTGSLGMHMWLKRFFVTVIFYVMLLFICIILLIIISFVLRYIVSLAPDHTQIFSILLSFLIAFCIICVLIILSIAKNFKACIMVILYHDMRLAQNKPTLITTKEIFPRTSRDLSFAIAMICMIIIGASVILSFVIHDDAMILIHNTDRFTMDTTFSPTTKLINTIQTDPHSLAEEAIINRQTFLQTIEEIVMRYILFITRT